MSSRSLDPQLLSTLSERFRVRLRASLALARADRFVRELEPSPGDEQDLFAGLAEALRGWRRGLRDGDTVSCLDAMEASWSRLEACGRAVAERDAAIEAFRLRWAGENAAFSDSTIDALARFYRLLPFSKSSQSKYEYVLTRRLAGPLVPDRRLPPTEELLDAMVVLESSWGAPPAKVPEDQVEEIVRAIRAYGQEASEKEDAASFTASALLRRFSAFKVSIGPALYEPRVSVAVVETNVRVLNVLNQLLTDAGGQPMRGVAGIGRPSLSLPVSERRPALKGPSRPPSPEAPPPISPADREAEEARKRALFRTSEIDLSGLEIAGILRKTPAPPKDPPASAKAPTMDGSEPGALAEPAATEASPARKPLPNLKTGDVDLSGLEFLRGHRDSDPAASSPGTAVSTPESDPAQAGTTAGRQSDDREEAGDEDASLEGGVDFGDVESLESEQQPSPRAFELGKLEANATIIERYLTRPRSPEVWRLNLDSFLSTENGGAEAQSHASDRRRALDLILTADDLIGLRRTQEGASTAEHRSKVKELAQAMLRLQTALRRAAGLSPGDRGELEPLLYVSDHLLWERLRLTASLTRNPVRNRPPVLPRGTRAAEAVQRQARVMSRHRRILVWSVWVAATLTLVIGLAGATAPRTPVDPEVRLLQVTDLPQPQIFTDARAFRNRLFITADLSWTRLGQDEQRTIVRTVASYAGARGYDTISIVGPNGEAWATFKDDEVTLESELLDAPTPTPPAPAS